MPKSTPGPWKIGKRLNAVTDEAGTIIANCEFSHSSKKRLNGKPTGEQSIANARLIAASPDLLKILKWLDSMGGLGLDKHEVIRGALAVAEGADGR